MQAERLILIDVPDRWLGERVVVRPYRDEDAVALTEAIEESKDRLTPWLAWAARPSTIDDQREFIRRGRAGLALREDFHLGIFSRPEDRLLGGVGLHLRNLHVPTFEISYWVRTSEEGKGYVGEAVRLITAFAFETLGANRVIIQCDSRNVRSKHVPERLGYTLEGRLRNAVLDTSGELCDVLLFAMTPADYAHASREWGPPSSHS